MTLMKLALLPLLLWSLTGCQTLSEKKQTTALEETLRKYEATMRWGALAQARSFALDDSANFSPTRNKDLRIIHYEVVQGPAQVSEEQALQTVLIQYVLESSQNVRELMDQQIWEYDAEAEKWYLQSPFPVFK